MLPGIVDSAVVAAAGDEAHSLPGGVWLDGSADYFSLTPSAASNQKTWTWSGWIRRGSLGSEQAIFGARLDGNNYVGIAFQSDDTLRIVYKQVSATGGSLSSQTRNKTTSRVFRDVGSFYNIVCKFDAANTNCDIYVNGEEITSFGTNEEPQNLDFSVNDNCAHYIGHYPSSE